MRALEAGGAMPRERATIGLRHLLACGIASSLLYAERVNIGAFLVWVSVLSLTLRRRIPAAA